MTGKAVLINPPVPDSKVWVREGRCQQWDFWGAPFPSYSLAMISTQLKKSGMETLIIDSGSQGKLLDEVLSDCDVFNSAIAFIAVSSPTIKSDLGWFSLHLKKRLPSIKIVAIGIHVSRFPAEVLTRYPALDYVIVGEPELTSGELAVAVREAKEHGSIRGLAWKDGEGKVHVNPRREFVEDLDSLGFPDWGDTDFSMYQMPVKERPFSLIGFSRGCPFQCTFCASHIYGGKLLRKRSVESLIEEIDFNISLGVTDFLFWTELMTLDIDFLDDFLEALIKKGLHKQISWVCNSRVDSSSRELFVKMKKAGCWQIVFGFEFGDDKILQLAKKGGRATTELGRKTAALADEAGIIVDGHFIMGYPGETPDTLQKTIDYACSLPLTFAHFYAATPFPGSVFYDEAVQNGWLDLELEGVNQNECVVNTEFLDAGTVNRYIRKAYRTFYLRPVIVKRGLFIPSGPKEFLNLLKIGYRFYRGLKG
jgi:radical SAM superfamily enzyme YgiQ (UPF0313 family)